MTSHSPGGDRSSVPIADPSQPWRLRFWMGGWDGDALCGYLRGGNWEVAVDGG